MPTRKLTDEIITAAIEGFESRKRRIDAQIAGLRVLLTGGPAETAATPEAPTRQRRKFSAATRRRMREAQQRRWANILGASEPPAPAEAPKGKRRISEAGIAATKKAAPKRKLSPAAKAKLLANLAKARAAKAAKKAAA